MNTWTRVYLILVEFLGTTVTYLFNMFINHLWIFIPFMISFACLTVSLFLRFLMAVHNSDV